MSCVLLHQPCLCLPNRSCPCRAQQHPRPGLVRRHPLGRALDRGPWAFLALCVSLGAHGVGSEVHGAGIVGEAGVVVGESGAVGEKFELLGVWLYAIERSLKALAKSQLVQRPGTHVMRLKPVGHSDMRVMEHGSHRARVGQLEYLLVTRQHHILRQHPHPWCRARPEDHSPLFLLLNLRLDRPLSFFPLFAQVCSGPRRNTSERRAVDAPSQVQRQVQYLYLHP